MCYGKQPPLDSKRVLAAVTVCLTPATAYTHPPLTAHLPFVCMRVQAAPRRHEGAR